MPKQTRLDDDASIYQPRKVQTEKEKLKEMSFRKKIEYLGEYYKFHALVAVVIIAAGIYIINTILNPASSTQFYAAIINSSADENTMKKYNLDFAKYLDLDTAKQNVDLNTTYYLGSQDSYSMNLREALLTRISAKEVDVIIAPESEFYQYAYAGGFVKLSGLLPTDIYSSLADNLYLTHTEDDNEQSAYGIYLSGTEFNKIISKNSEPYIIGILANSRHMNHSIEFVRYLFKNK